jgi:ATP synthase protein I
MLTLMDSPAREVALWRGCSQAAAAFHPQQGRAQMPVYDQNRPSVGPESLESGPIEHDPRLEALDARLDAAHVREATRTGKSKFVPKSSGMGERIFAQLIGTPLGGGLLGWFLDRWFDTKPWLFLAMLFLGFVVAGRNIYKISKEPTK